MALHPQLSILVISSHPLLGEGLGRLLAAEPGVRVTHTNGSQLERVDAALALLPNVVVVERHGGLDARQIMERLPDALIIDIGIGPGPTWVYRRHEIPGDSHAILELVRLLRHGHPVISFGEVSRSAEAPLIHSGV